MARQTHVIKRKAAASLLQSARTAEAIGRPLSLLVTINYWQIGLVEAVAVEEFAKMRHGRFQRWSSYMPKGSNTPRNGVPTYAYVFEAPAGRVHVHWTVHIGSGNRAHFEKSLQRWLLKASGLSTLPHGSLDIRDNYNPEGTKLYLAKGMEPQHASRCKITPEDCGVIFGARCNVSRNIGPAIWKPRYQGYKQQSLMKQAA